MKYTWLVEKYLEGELSGDALRKFELDILRKPEVAEEVERIRNLNEFSKEQHRKSHNYIGLVEDFDDIDNVIDEKEIGRQMESLRIRKISESQDGAVKDIKNRLADIYTEKRLINQNSNKVLVKKVSLWLAGSTMAIFITVFSLLLIGSGSPDYPVLFSEYYFARPADVSRTMSSPQETLFSNAMSFYRQERYAEAYELFKGIPQYETDVEHLIYMGICAMEMEEYITAVTILNKLDNDSVWKHESSWYKSLCYLALGDIKSTRFALDAIIRSNGYYKDNASSLLRKL